MESTFQEVFLRVSKENEPMIDQILVGWIGFV